MAAHGPAREHTATPSLLLPPRGDALPFAPASAAATAAAAAVAAVDADARAEAHAPGGFDFARAMNRAVSQLRAWVMDPNAPADARDKTIDALQQLAEDARVYQKLWSACSALFEPRLVRTAPPTDTDTGTDTGPAGRGAAASRGSDRHSAPVGAATLLCRLSVGDAVARRYHNTEACDFRLRWRPVVPPAVDADIYAGAYASANADADVDDSDMFPRDGDTSAEAVRQAPVLPPSVQINACQYRVTDHVSNDERDRPDQYWDYTKVLWDDSEHLFLEGWKIHCDPFLGDDVPVHDGGEHDGSDEPPRYSACAWDQFRRALYLTPHTTNAQVLRALMTAALGRFGHYTPPGDTRVMYERWALADADGGGGARALIPALHAVVSEYLSDAVPLPPAANVNGDDDGDG